eukprot:2666465-Rhodomonas_salina.1
MERAEHMDGGDGVTCDPSTKADGFFGWRTWVGRKGVRERGGRRERGVRDVWRIKLSCMKEAARTKKKQGKDAA